MNDGTGIRELLGDAPEEARRAAASERVDEPAMAPIPAQDRGDDMTDRNSYEPDQTGASGVERDSTLSTADVANATATPVREDDARTDESAGLSDRAPQRDPDESRRGASAAGSVAAATSAPPASAPQASAPAASPSDSTAAAPAPGGDTAPLFPADQATSLRDRWTDVQASFVDEPRQAVKQADALVADVIQKLAQSFADERSKLERQWDRGEDVDTEDLRVALRRYRSFFDRLLAL